MADRTGTGKPLGYLLSPNEVSLTFTFDTATATNAGRVVQVTAHRTVSQVDAAADFDADADLACLGIAMETVVLGDECLICLRGLIVAEAGADLTIGQWAMPDSVGRVVTGSTGLTGTGVTVLAAAAGSPAEGYIGVGICILKDAAAVAGDGVGILVK